MISKVIHRARSKFRRQSIRFAIHFVVNIEVDLDELSELPIINQQRSVPNIYSFRFILTLTILYNTADQRVFRRGPDFVERQEIQIVEEKFVVALDEQAFVGTVKHFCGIVLQSLIFCINFVHVIDDADTLILVV